jgi:hypothetical protein
MARSSIAVLYVSCLAMSPKLWLLSKQAVATRLHAVQANARAGTRAQDCVLACEAFQHLQQQEEPGSDLRMWCVLPANPLPACDSAA